MTPAEAHEAVGVAHAVGANAEASGGSALMQAGEHTATGVDYFAVGALTPPRGGLGFGF